MTTRLITKQSFFAVVPQPVYMNMNDLAIMKQKQQQQQQMAEDSPELKTPTAEDQLPVPEQKVISIIISQTMLTQ